MAVPGTAQLPCGHLTKPSGEKKISISEKMKRNQQEPGAEGGGEGEREGGGGLGRASYSC